MIDLDHTISQLTKMYDAATEAWLESVNEGDNDPTTIQAHALHTLREVLFVAGDVARMTQKVVGQ